MSANTVIRSQNQTIQANRMSTSQKKLKNV
jgi:hypothetical protein